MNEHDLIKKLLQPVSEDDSDIMQDAKKVFAKQESLQNPYDFTMAFEFAIRAMATRYLSGV